MARFFDQNASTKVTAATTTVTFTPQDLPTRGIVALHFLFTGAGMTFGDLSRIRVKVGGATLWDVSGTHLIQFIARFSRGRVVPAAGDTTFTLPFYLPDQENEDAADVSQLPAGPTTVELVIGAGGAAGTVQVAYTLSTVAPQVYPVLLESNLNIAASASGAGYPLDEVGVVQAIGINSVGLTRLQVILSGHKRVEIEGTALLGETQRQYDAQAATTDPRFIKLPGPESALSGASRLILDTAAGWAGAANDFSLFAYRAQAA